MKRMSLIMVMMVVMMSGVTWNSLQGTFTFQLAEAQRRLYKPPLRRATASRVRSGTRGPADRLPSVWALAPDHLGLTMHEQPELYWYLSKASTHLVEIVVRDSVSIEPLFEMRLKPPVAAGIHRTRLAEHGVRLEPNVSYEWFVAILTSLEDPSLEIVTRGTIQRVVPDDLLQQQMEIGLQNPTTRAGAWEIYASAGMWYDAMAALSTLIAEAPQDATLREQRAALLDEISLPEAAAYARNRP